MKFILIVSRAANVDEKKAKEAFNKLGFEVELIYVDGDPYQQVIRLESIG